MAPSKITLTSFLKQRGNIDTVLFFLFFRLLDLRCGKNFLNETELKTRSLSKLINKFKSEPGCIKYKINYEYLKDLINSIDTKNSSSEILNEILTIEDEQEVKTVFNRAEDIKYYTEKRGVDYRKIEEEAGKLVNFLRKESDNIEQIEIYNPFEYSGHFLVSASEKDDFLYAEIIDSSEYLRVLLKLLLSGRENYEIKIGNPVKKPQFIESKNSLKKFDVIVSNLSFFDRLEFFVDTRKDTFKRFSNRLIPHRARPVSLYISHVIASMKEEGVSIIIVPQGFLSRGGRDIDFRKNLIEKNLIDSVFQPPTDWVKNTFAKFSILILRKKKRDSNILFVKLGENAQEIEPIYRKIMKNNLPNDFMALVKKDEIFDNFNLEPEYYVEQKETIRDIEQIRDDIEKTKAYLSKLDDEILKKIKKNF